MSDTPRTDAECARQNNEGWSLPDTRKFGRQLERELTAVTAERDEYKDLLIRVYDDLFVHRNMGEAIRDLKILMGAVQLTDALAAVKGVSDE